jgi:4-carboxymuconolactone decarboxylase
MSDETYERALKVRREMAGSETVDRELASINEFERPMYDLVTTYCFGAVWGRPGLSPKIRSLVTMAIAAAINRQGALKNHARNAIRHGATKDEIREVMLHVAIYAGVAAGGESMRAAREVLEEAGKL